MSLWHPRRGDPLSRADFNLNAGETKIGAFKRTMTMLDNLLSRVWAVISGCGRQRRGRDPTPEGGVSRVYRNSLSKSARSAARRRTSPSLRMGPLELLMWTQRSNSLAAASRSSAFSFFSRVEWARR
jgi:hypothetical protein